MHVNLIGLVGIVGVAALSLLPARAATTAVLSYTPGEFQGFGAPTVSGGAMNEVTGPFTFSNVDGLGLNVTVSASAPAITEYIGNSSFPVAGLMMGDGATSVFTWQLNAGYTLNWIEFDFLYLSQQELSEISRAEERLSNFYGTGANIASASLFNASNATWDGTTIDPTSDGGSGTFRVEFDGEVSQFGWQYDLVRGSPAGAAISELRLGLVQVQGGNTPPTVTITNPVNGAVFTAPATFTVEASASDPGGSISQVQFFLGSTFLGTDTASPYSANVNNLAAGTYTLSARATDNQNARATNSITVIVNAGPTVDPTFSDANWSSMGVNGSVRAAVVDGSGNLYIGGFFTISGDVFATNIAKWNGSRWSALGSSSGMTNLSALAVSGSDLYAGGDFWTAGGTLVNHIAKWNGTNWSALGSGMNGSVYGLVVSGSNLYAGGRFTTAGGTSARNIAKWDGSSWSAVPGSGMNGNVRALAVSGSDLYAAGQIETTLAADQMAKWDGSSWTPLGSGMNLYVLALAVSGTDLYAGGYFTTAGGTTANYIAKWNGKAWSALGSGVGRTDNFRPFVSALAVSGSDLYAGGQFTTAGGSPANYIAKWDGTTWNPLGSGMNNYVFALAVSGSSLYAGGWFTTAGGKASVGIAKARIASAAKSINASGSSATIQFSGVVGYKYHVQRTASLTSPMTWTTLTTTPLSPADDGSFSFIDTTPPPGTAYYRLVQH